MATIALQPSVADILVERGNRYGEFMGHAVITQTLKEAIRLGPSYHRMDADMVEAAEMICHKLGRIANGDPHYADSWVDIAGYAQLVVDRLTALQNARGL